MCSEKKNARYSTSFLPFKSKNHYIGIVAFVKFPIALKSSKVTSSNLVKEWQYNLYNSSWANLTTSTRLHTKTSWPCTILMNLWTLSSNGNKTWQPQSQLHITQSIDIFVGNIIFWTFGMHLHNERLVLKIYSFWRRKHRDLTSIDIM